MFLGCWMAESFWEKETVKGDSPVYKHVNLEHAMFKFYVLTEGYYPSSMP